MKVVILAGGFGTRLQEESAIRPKPLVEIGGRPMLWHIMSIYAAYGHSEFIVALGYKGEMIKHYFLNYYSLMRDVTVDLGKGTVEVHDGSRRENWTVQLVDTGEKTQTGGRVKRLAPWIGQQPFMLTYGDGVSDIDINALVAFHKNRGHLATVTAVRPSARFGSLILEDDFVIRFEEKPRIGEGWINGGFFVCEPGVLDYIGGDETLLEREPLERLAADKELVAYRHDGFWQCMDTLRDMRLLEDLWNSGRAPWKVWKE